MTHPAVLHNAANDPGIIPTPSRTVLKARDVESWLSRNLTRGGAELNVSRRYVVRLCDSLSLTEADLDTLVGLKTSYSAGIPTIAKFLQRGEHLQDVESAYAARDVIKSRIEGKGGNASVRHLLRFIRTFPGVDAEPEELGSFILELHRGVAETFRWVRYIDQSIRTLCEVADAYNLASADTALDAIQSQGRTEDDDGRHPPEEAGD